MKKHTSFYLIVSLIFLTSCTKKLERVAITTNISVELPENYELKSKKSISADVSNPELKNESEQSNYKAKINDDEIFIIKMSIDEYNDLGLEKKKEKIESFLNGFIKPFNGSNLTLEQKIDNRLVQDDFQFESEIKDSLYVVYGKLIIHDNDLLVFN